MQKYESFDEYIEAQSEKAKQMLLHLRKLIYEVIPNVEESMSYGVPAFNMIPNAKLNDKIMIASFKKHVGFYPHTTTIDAFKEKLKPYTTLKGTVQFLFTQEIPDELVKEMTLYRFNQVNKKKKSS